MDSNIILDVATDDPRWGRWSSESLRRAAEEAILVIEYVLTFSNSRLTFMQKEENGHALIESPEEQEVDSSRPRFLKVTLLFPILDNDGEPFDVEVWRWWQREMQRLGDYTEMNSADGIFRGHTDRNRVIVMIIEPEAIEPIREFLREARRHFDQESMYLEFHSVDFELVR